MNFKFFKPLSIAILMIGMGQAILAMEKDPNQKLLEATEKGNIEMILHALDHGADINCTDSIDIGDTPLHITSRANYLEITKLLLEHGAETNRINNDCDTPLHIASRKNHREIAKLLLDNGADINRTNSTGETPLYLASIKNHLKIVKLLVKSGADINCANIYGNTPLHIASLNNNPKIVKLLLNYDADIDLTNKDGETALDFAEQFYHNEISKLIADAKKRKMQEEYNSLMLAQIPTVNIFKAIQAGNLKVVKSILSQNNFNINCFDENGYTPLHCASCTFNIESETLIRDYLKIVKELLKSGADVNCLDKFRLTPLHYASLSGNKKLVKLLLDHGADVNGTTYAGDTPLLFAIKRPDMAVDWSPHQKIVKLLLDRGADINYIDNEGKTALDIAQEEKFQDIEQLITNELQERKRKQEYLDLTSKRLLTRLSNTNDFTTEKILILNRK